MMRDPLNLNSDVTYNVGSVLRLDNIPEYDAQDYDLFDDKDRKKFFDDVERTIRTSFEYRSMVKYLHDNMDMNRCSYYENVNNIDTYKIKIHIHHDPITLYDMCVIVFNKKCAYNEYISKESIAKEVMFLHYDLMVGLIPLSETVHELVHNQYIFVPTDKVFGRYKKFVKQYNEFMTIEQLDVLDRIEEYTRVCNESYKDILAKNYIYIDMSGSYNLPNFNFIMDMMKQRIQDIKTNTMSGEQHMLKQVVTFVDKF